MTISWLGDDDVIQRKCRNKDSSSLSRLSADGVHNETHKWRVETSSSGVGSGQYEIVSRLIMDKAEPSSAGLYECEVSANMPDSANELGLHSSSGGNSNTGVGDRLRRLFGLLVNGK